MKIHIVVALVLCNFYFITNGCNYERTDVYKLNIGENLRIRSGCTDEDEIRSIQWFFVLNGDSLYAQTPENVTSFAVPETGDLLLDSLKENNNGSYHFKVSEASSDKKQRSENIPVIVKWQGKETSVSLFLPRAEDLSLGNGVKLVCNFFINPKPAKIDWYRGGKKLSNSSNIAIEYDVLTIRQLTAEDLAIYVCRVDNIFEEKPFILEAPNGRTTVNRLETSTLCPLIVKEGDPLWVHFRDIGGTFLLNGNKLYSSNGYSVFPRNGSVYVSAANRTLKSIDLISTKSGIAHNCPINVTYMDPPTLQPNTMYFGGGTITETSFICTAGSANPPPTKYAWFRNNQPLREKESASTRPGEPTVTSVTNAIVLNLPPSYKPIPGEKFECHIGTNEKAMSVLLKIIFVKFSPAEKTSFEIKEGEMLRLQCMANGSDIDLFEFHWTPFDHNADAAVKSLIERSQRSNNGNVLTLKNASTGDSVKITCGALGKFSQISSFALSNTLTINVLSGRSEANERLMVRRDVADSAAATAAAAESSPFSSSISLQPVADDDDDAANEAANHALNIIALTPSTNSRIPLSQNSSPENEPPPSALQTYSSNSSPSGEEGGEKVVANNVEIPPKRESKERFKFLNPNVWENKTFVHYIKADETSTISCQAEGPGDVAPSISWSFMESAVPSATANNSGTFPSGVFISPNQTMTKDLVFKEAAASQNGIYQCLAKLENPGNEPEQLTLKFNVKVLDDIALLIKKEPVDQTVAKGDRVEFSCEPKLMNSDDQPDTRWWYEAFPSSSPQPVEKVIAAKQQQQRIELMALTNSSDDANLELKPPRIKIVNSTVLVIEDVQPEDQGKYWCIFNRTFNYGNQDLNSTKKARLIVAASSASGDQSMRTIAIAVACAVGYILFMLALTIYCRRKRLASRNRQLNKNGGLNGDEKGGAGVPDGANEPLVNANGRLSPTRELMPLQRRNLNVEKLQFPRQELQTTSLLGRGEYGDVFLAVAQGLHLNDSSVPRSTAGSASSSPTPSGEQLVMVKSLLQKEKNLQEKFQVEMEQYAQLRCVNVTRLLGVCTETDPLYLIFEYTEWGDLKRFLMSTKGHSGLPQAPAIELTHKLHIAYQALRGLEYLANHKLVHKDIAARNFLLTADLGVKLSNASLCKDVYRSEYFEYHDALIPLRWMPLEAVYDESFSQMSDAYSFGVTLWEIFSLGVLPYQELTNEQVLKGMTVGELKLSPPIDCPPQVAEIMMKCWEECAINRPSFSHMLTILTSINVDSSC